MPPSRKFTDSQCIQIYHVHESGVSFWRLSRRYDASPDCLRKACHYAARKLHLPVRGKRSYRPKRTLTVYLLACVKGGLLTVKDASEISGLPVRDIRKELTQK